MTQGRYFHLDEVTGAEIAAARIVPVVQDLVRGVHSVVDVGGGTGAWLRAFQAHGVRDVTLYDAAVVEPHLLVARDRFRAIDLSRELPPPGRFDLAVCVECAEHLDASRARPLIKWLSAAAERVVFSAAIMHQGGKGHLNEQPPDYWKRLFAEFGFARHDVVRPRIVHDQSIPYWYRQNLFLFAAEGTMTDLPPDFLPGDLHLLHEHVRQRLEDPGVRRSARQLLRAVLSGVRRTLCE